MRIRQSCPRAWDRGEMRPAVGLSRTFHCSETTISPRDVRFRTQSSLPENEKTKRFQRVS